MNSTTNQHMPKVSVTRPVRPLTQTTCDVMSTRRPAIHTPFGLDADIEHIVVLPKTFKEKKAEEDRLQKSTLPPRLPMETNLNTLYRSNTKKDYVQYDIPVRQSPLQVCSHQKYVVNKLS